MLEIVTFTGVDAATDLDRLEELAQRYRWTEFGVLVGSQTPKRSGVAANPIFPPLEILDELRKRLPDDRLALHLCGRYAREALVMHAASTLPAMCEGFGRVQINLHGDVDAPERISAHQDRIVAAAERLPCTSVIIQHRGDWSTVPVSHPLVEYLFDRSEGRGEEGFEHWPPPPAMERVGYAGGIGPDNIDLAIEFAQRHRERPIWIDMERNVRTDGYWLDLDRVEAVCRRVDVSGTAARP